MDRRELPDRAAHSPEERLLLSRVWDKCEQCRTRNIPTATGFLSPAEQAAAQGFLVLLGARESGIFWGGYDGAERRRLVFLPDCWRHLTTRSRRCGPRAAAAAT